MKKRLKITRTAALCCYTYKTENAARPSYEKTGYTLLRGQGDRRGGAETA